MAESNKSEVLMELTIIDGFTRYRVCNNGDIISYVYGSRKVLKGDISNNGYKRVTLYSGKEKYRETVHRLIAKCFVSNPENKPQVNHINGNKLDNRASNLEWVSGSENIRHSLDTGLAKVAVGSDYKRSNLTDEDIKDIRNKYVPYKYTTIQLAAEYGVSRQNISNIVNNKVWRHV